MKKTLARVLLAVTLTALIFAILFIVITVINYFLHLGPAVLIGIGFVCVAIFVYSILVDLEKKKP